MKAILNVNKNSSYAEGNGLTFPVVEVMSKIVVLDLNGTKTDFGHSEIIIVDFAIEFQRAYDDFNWDSKRDLYLKLENYRQRNNIVYKPTYNCPA